MKKAIILFELSRIPSWKLNILLLLLFLPFVILQNVSYSKQIRIHKSSSFTGSCRVEFQSEKILFHFRRREPQSPESRIMERIREPNRRGSLPHLISSPKWASSSWSNSNHTQMDSNDPWLQDSGKRIRWKEPAVDQKRKISSEPSESTTFSRREQSVWWNRRSHKIWKMIVFLASHDLTPWEGKTVAIYGFLLLKTLSSLLPSSWFLAPLNDTRGKIIKSSERADERRLESLSRERIIKREEEGMMLHLLIPWCHKKKAAVKMLNDSYVFGQTIRLAIHHFNCITATIIITLLVWCIFLKRNSSYWSVIPNDEQQKQDLFPASGVF